MVGGGESVDPLGGGGEQDSVAGLAGADRQAGGQVGLAGAGRAEEDHVLAGGDEVQGSQVGDLFAFEPSGVVEVEVLQRLAPWEPGGADTTFTAVGLSGCDLPLQAGSQELLMGPGLGSSPFSEPVDGFAQGRGLQRAGEERQLSADVARLGRGHQATSVSPNAAS